MISAAAPWASACAMTRGPLGTAPWWQGIREITVLSRRAPGTVWFTARRGGKNRRRAVSTPLSSIDIDNDDEGDHNGDKNAVTAGEKNARDVKMDDNSNSYTGKYRCLVKNASGRRLLWNRAVGVARSLGDRRTKMGDDDIDEDDDENLNENDDKCGWQHHSPRPRATT